MIKGFRDFVMRGNIVELAIAVVIGAAFGGVVSQLTKSFIEPLIKVVSGGGVRGGAFIVRGVAFDWSASINAFINFLIVAAVIYFVIVVPMNKITARMKAKEQVAPPSTPADVQLLTEIRDLLKKSSS